MASDRRVLLLDWPCLVFTYALVVSPEYEEVAAQHSAR